VTGRALWLFATAFAIQGCEFLYANVNRWPAYFSWVRRAEMGDFVGRTAEYCSTTSDLRITEGFCDITKTETGNKIERF
jgi:hypothetical protein